MLAGCGLELEVEVDLQLGVPVRAVVVAEVFKGVAGIVDKGVGGAEELAIEGVVGVEGDDHQHAFAELGLLLQSNVEVVPVLGAEGIAAHAQVGVVGCVLKQL